MKSLLFLFIVGLFAVVTKADDGALSKAEMKGIQDKLDKLHVIEQFFNLIGDNNDDAESRADDCLPVGAVCSITGKQNCCGIRTRCFIWDELKNTRTRGGLKQEWISHCKEYNAGRWMDSIGKFFSGLG